MQKAEQASCLLSRRSIVAVREPPAAEVLVREIPSLGGRVTRAAKLFPTSPIKPVSREGARATLAERKRGGADFCPRAARAAIRVSKIRPPSLSRAGWRCLLSRLPGGCSNQPLVQNEKLFATPVSRSILENAAAALTVIICSPSGMSQAWLSLRMDASFIQFSAKGWSSSILRQPE